MRRRKGICSAGILLVFAIVLVCMAGPVKEAKAGDYSNGGCVRWVKDRAQAVYGMNLGSIGNGSQVFNNLKARGYATGWEPRPNSIACWLYNSSTDADWRKLGHVAWVENVSGSTVYVSEGGYRWDKTDKNGNYIGTDWGWYLGNKGVVYRAKSNLSGSGFQGYVYLGSKAAPVSKPSTPSNVKLNKSDFGIGENLTVTWNAASGATGYDVYLECTSNSNYNDHGYVTATNGFFPVKHPGTYRVKVVAKNSAGSSGAAYSTTCTVHDNVKVWYADYDDMQIGAIQTIRWGSNATPPAAPKREGYDFIGWENDGKNITKSGAIKAQYKIKTYSVSFVDYKGDVIGNIQKVEHGKSAVAPKDIPAKEGYIFSEWDTKDFEKVTKNMTVKAVYVWENTNLPIITKIVSAKRNAEATGYDVEVKLTNFPNDFTSGKLVAALKTKKGKMVASEIKSVSMPTDGVADVKFTILYSGLAPQVEVSMIGVADDDTTGTPKSKIVSSAVDIGNEWSDWGAEVPSGNGVVKESRTEYRYKTKLTKKAVTTPVTPAGYTLTGSQKLDEYTAYGGWTNWSRGAVSKTATTNVQTHVGYRYYAFVCPNCGARDPYSGSCSNCGASGLNWVEDWGTCLGQDYGPGFTSVNNSRGKIYWNNAWWYFEKPGYNNGAGGTGQPTTTLYSYQTRQQYSQYTYCSKEFTEWSGEKVTDANATQVETRTAYRFKTNATEVPCYNYKRYKYTNVNNGKVVYTYSSKYADSKDYPGEWEYKTSFTELSKVTGTGEDEPEYGTAEDCWYKADVNEEGNVTEFETTSSLEDQSGTARKQDGKLEGSAGKVATLMVYKGKNSDPIASQMEYIGQTKIGEDGSYHFDYVTKEEPTAKTGDFMITLGVEGATNYIDLGKIDAPKKIYTVDFVDEDGNLIGDHKSVAEGGTVETPKAPEKEGYEFIGWDTALRNIQENTVVTAQYRKKKFTVIFVDWDDSYIDVKDYSYGDELELPEKVLEKAGQKFSEWVDEDGKTVEKVTKNMIVSAKYKDTAYTVTFTDYDGNVISEQEVKYGEEAKLPSSPVPQNAKQKFAGWSSEGDEKYVMKDLVIKPLAMWKEDSEKPVFSIKTGTYTEEQKIAIYSETSNTDIYYAINENGNAAEDNDFSDVQYKKYEKPFKVSKDCVITAYAVSDTTNQSELETLELKFKNGSEPDPSPEPTPSPEPETVKIAKVDFAKTSFVYNGKVQRPKFTVTGADKKKLATDKFKVTYSAGCKNVGKYTVKVTGITEKGYTGTISKTYTILPKGTSISSVKAQTKGFTVIWKKQASQTKGYQIQYSTSSKFSGAKTVTITKNTTVKKAVSKLSRKKKYYVRVRTYMSAGSAKYYSAWSGAKSVKTK